MRKSVSMGLVASVLGMGMANAEVKVSDALTLSGFVDKSITSGMPASGPMTLDASLDQVELDLAFKLSDKLSLRIDIAQGGAGGAVGTGALGAEQAYFTYALSEKLNLMGGRFLSSTGFESAEPTGLYQYSASVYCDGVGQAIPCVYGGYQNGVAASYSISPMISVYGALVGSTAGAAATGVDAAGSTSLKDPAVEVQVSLMPVEGVTVKAAYLYDAFAGAPEAYNLANVWASYAKGPLLVGAEFNYFTNFTAVDDNGTSWLAMANYKLTDKFAATARVSAITSDLGEDETGVTLSPSYAVNANWLIVAEVSRLLDAEVTALALESLIMF